MATTTQLLEYTVWLTDRATVAHMQQASPNGWFVEPDYNATFFQCAIQFTDQKFSAPSVRSPLFIRNNNNFPRNVEQFSRKVGGWFGIHWLFGDTIIYKWVARYAYAPSDSVAIEGAPVQAVGIATRKWVQGFEFPQDGESGGTSIGTDGDSVHRNASRHNDGFGWSCRCVAGQVVSRSIADIVGTPASNQSWERFYINIRRVPDATVRLWRNTGSIAASNGLFLNLKTTMVLQIQSSTGAGVTDLADSVTPLVINTWYRVDIIYRFGAPRATAKVYINRALVINPTIVLSTGIGATQNHISSSLGPSASNQAEIDYDDWICAEWPSLETSSERPVGLDWVNGSKVTLVRPTGFATAHVAANWTLASDWRNLLQMPSADLSSGTIHFTSIVSGAIMAVNTDVARAVTADHAVVGYAAINIIARGAGSVNPDGTLFYKINGGVLTGATVNFPNGSTAAVAGNTTIMYRPAGIIKPDAMTTLEIRFVKAANVTTVCIVSLAATVECLGIFGPEDVATEAVGTPATLPTRRGVHNSAYPLSPWARATRPFLAPYVIHSGLYTGNGTAQTLTFRTPVHWLWVRRVDTTANACRWFSSMAGQHEDIVGGCQPVGACHFLLDPTFVGTGDLDSQEIQCLVYIQGASNNSNANGITYQYVAVEDAAERFMHNGTFHHKAAVASIANALYKANYLPIAAFMQLESPDTVDGIDRLFYKGVGHAADAASILSAAETASVMSMTTGSLTSKTVLHNDNIPVVYNLWRRSDGNNYSDEARAVQIVTYTGDGTGARTVALTPASGRRPLFAIVTPHNGTSYQRDPSHSGGASSNVATGSIATTTAITGGGIDQIIVGATLNTIGIVYDVFVLPGSTDACNDGWSCNGEFILDPDVDPDDLFDDDPTDPPDDIDPDPDDDEDTGDPIDAPDSFPFATELEATRAIRIANLCSRVLHRLGDSEQKIWTESEIDSYLTQAAFLMATVIRLIWDQVWLENVPAGFHCNYDFEEDLLQFQWNYGVAVCNHEFELEYGENAGLWLIDQIQYANHTCPAELLHMVAVSASTIGRATMPVPRSLVEIERSTWDQRTMDALDPRDLAEWDSRYEITQGETWAYTWRKDGNRIYRKIRVPNDLPDLMTTDGNFGVPRNIDDASDEGVTGTWGIPRRIEGWHPMGSTVGFGTPRRFYYEQRNVKVEHWRKFEVECRMSNLVDGEVQRYAGEIPRHYFMYMADYCQWKALVRQSGGQNFKMAQLYKDRWERNLSRVANRVSRANKERLGRLGGNDPSPRGKPPRPRLPWQYGSKVR